MTVSASTQDRADLFDELDHAISDIAVGRAVIVVDDEHRENEGDLIMAAELAELLGLPLMTTATSRVATGVVSASPRRFVAATLDHFGLRRSLQVVVAREDQVHTKPCPRPWLYAAALLAVEPKTFVAVEGSAAEVRSAHAAGMRVPAIPGWAPTLSPSEAELAEHLAPDADHAQRWLNSIHSAQPDGGGRDLVENRW